jgi:hypothetical protein
LLWGKRKCNDSGIMMVGTIGMENPAGAAAEMIKAIKAK